VPASPSLRCAHMIQLHRPPLASCLCPTDASCFPLQALMDCGITAGVGDTSWPHLHNQENPWQAQVLSKANNQTVDGAHLHISPTGLRRRSLLPRACCCVDGSQLASIAAGSKQLPS
jgi:surfactin synthase thioesterase subunit